MAKTIKKTVKTKPPTGLSVTRDGAKYTAKWKIGDADYGGGQQLWYRIKFASGWGKWHSVKVAKDATERLVGEFKRSDYRPTTGKGSYFKALQVVVRGKRKAYEKTVKKQKYSYSCTVSDWTWFTYDVLNPDPPTISASLGEQDNQTSFSWSTSSDNTSRKIFTNCQLQTVLLKNFDGNIKNAKGWKGTSVVGGTGKKTFKEDSTILSKASYTRGVRIRARGPNGDSKWVYSKHVYAQPKKSVNVSASVVKNGGRGLTVTVRWKSGSPASKPIDNTIVQYAIVNPKVYGSSIVCPTGASWSDAANIKDTKNWDGTSFSVDAPLQKDEAIFVRVNNNHDRKVTYGTPTYAKGIRTNLNTPEITNFVDGEPETMGDGSKRIRATITVNTGCSVEGSYTIIYKRVRPKGKKNFTTVPVARIPWSSTGSATVTFRHWVSASTTTVQWAAENFAGGTVTSAEAKEGSYYYTKYSIKNSIMDSSMAIYNVTNQLTGVKLESTKTGTIHVTWNWPTNATIDAVELSWSSNQDAWNSTQGPETYRIENTNYGNWNIVGLDEGKTWYVRLRAINVTDDGELVGPWSPLTNDSSLSLASPPDPPNVTLSSNIIKPGEKVQVSWTYSSTDSTKQSEAEIRLATIFDDETFTYESTPIAKAKTNQSLTLNTSTWESGKTYYLTMRVKSKSQQYSDWSYPVSLGIAEPLTISVSSPSLVKETIVTDPDAEMVEVNTFLETSDTFTGDGSETQFSTTKSLNEVLSVSINGSDISKEDYSVIDGGIVSFKNAPASGASIIIRYDTFTEVDEDGAEVGTDMYTDNGRDLPTVRNILEEMPLSVNVTGAGEDGTTTVIIERASSYYLNRPDENIFKGFAGEIIASREQRGEGTITFENVDSDIVGTLDDDATYRITATIEDSIGQVAKTNDETSIDFTVHWSHQALMPDARCQIDEENYISIITPIAPEGYVSGDTCDIYRLSIDKPQLIYSGASFGVSYVDPFPTIGEFGGHRIVYKTSNGDYITETNNEGVITKELAWIDTRDFEDESDILYTDYTIINFGLDRIEVLYNVNLSNSWAKDFKQTKYLGGSIQGDWNPAVSRTGSVGTVYVKDLDHEMMESMRRLADYPGICHIRTSDGSSFACDIQVSENNGYDSFDMVTYSLSITKVDSETMDGMTLEEWQELYGD